jgi:5-methylcytosine-specific restriction protein A
MDHDRLRGNSGERGYDSLWRKVRNRKLSKSPLCERCLKVGNRDTAATLVHHIKPISEGGDRLAMNNLMSCCVPCHEEIHKDDRFGRKRTQGAVND